MQLELKDYKVEIKDEVTWGDSQKIEDSIFSSAKMKGDRTGEMRFDFDGSAILKAKYIAMKCVIIKIEKDGTEIPFTNEWVDNLSLTDGDKLYSAVEEVTKKK